MSEQLQQVVDATQPRLNKTLDDVLQQVVTKLGATQAATLAPVISQYGPAFVQMTSSEIYTWLDNAIRGDAYSSYAVILAKLPQAKLSDEWSTLADRWANANLSNAASIAWQKDALNAVLRALVTIAAAQVGL